MRTVEGALFEGGSLRGGRESDRSGSPTYYLEWFRIPSRCLDLKMALSAVVWSSIVADILGITMKVYEYH